jgi:O-antigen biosynthesis protein
VGASLRRLVNRLIRPTPKVCVYTAVFAGYDKVLDHARQTVRCDFFVFTDDISGVPSAIRGVVKVDPGGQTSPVLKNAWLRLFPFDLPELNTYDLIIYIDANVRIVDPMFVEGIVGRWREAPFDLILSAHPSRTCAYNEATVSREIPKYVNTDLERQIDTYRRAGFPKDAGLYWNGFIVFRRNGDLRRLRHFQEMYWREIIAYNRAPLGHPQGQVSLPYCLWKCDLDLVVVPPLYETDPAIEILPHQR